jgi:transcriptional regulator with XRE-family HTH domain
MFTKLGKHLGMAMDILGQRLRELREQRGLTVRQFADRIKKTPGYVSRIEARGEIPSPELLCEIAGVYDIAPEELLRLAKQCYLHRTEREVEAKNVSALALYRKERK